MYMKNIVKIGIISLCSFVLTGCLEQTMPFKSVSYKLLKSFEKDINEDERAYLKKICTFWQKTSKNKVLYTSLDAWKSACKRVEVCLDAENKPVQTCLKHAFKVVEFTSETPLYTGYFSPIYKGSLTQTETFNTPLYQYPEDMITASLDAFNEDYESLKLVGRIQGNKFVPYATREEISKKGIKATPLVWLSAVDAFFVHIQGSAYIQIQDGTELHVAYAGHNGHPYFAIGRTLYKRGILAKEEITMQNIRQWLEKASTKDVQDVLNQNKRYIFFKKGKGYTSGSLGVALEEKRSLAVDPRYIPLGAPLWVETEETLTGKKIEKLMIATDTGAAIEGKVRGDIYFGKGKKAGEKAGYQKASGRLFMFMPINNK